MDCCVCGKNSSGRRGTIKKISEPIPVHTNGNVPTETAVISPLPNNFNSNSNHQSKLTINPNYEPASPFVDGDPNNNNPPTVNTVVKATRFSENVIDCDQQQWNGSDRDSNRPSLDVIGEKDHPSSLKSSLSGSSPRALDLMTASPGTGIPMMSSATSSSCLSYITDRVMVISFPVDLIHDKYCSVLQSLSKILTSRYAKKYKIFNLGEPCDLLNSTNEVIVNYRWLPDLAPSIESLFTCCRDLELWLITNPAYVAVLFCRGRLGPLATCLAAYMYYYRHRATNDESALLEQMALKRYYDDQLSTVSAPSQKRYVQYFSCMLNGAFKLTPEVALTLFAVTLHTLSSFSTPSTLSKSSSKTSSAEKCNTGRFHLKVYQRLALVYSSPVYFVTGDKQVDKIIFLLEPAPTLSGDILIKCFYRKSQDAARRIVFRLQIHSAAISEECISFYKQDLDDASSDFRFSPSGRVELRFGASLALRNEHESCLSSGAVYVDYSLTDQLDRQHSYRAVKSPTVNSDYLNELAVITSSSSNLPSRIQHYQKPPTGLTTKIESTNIPQNLSASPKQSLESSIPNSVHFFPEISTSPTLNKSETVTTSSDVEMTYNNNSNGMHRSSRHKHHFMPSSGNTSSHLPPEPTILSSRKYPNYSGSNAVSNNASEYPANHQQISPSLGSPSMANHRQPYHRNTTTSGLPPSSPRQGHHSQQHQSSYGGNHILQHSSSNSVTITIPRTSGGSHPELNNVSGISSDNRTHDGGNYLHTESNSSPKYASQQPQISPSHHHASMSKPPVDPSSVSLDALLHELTSASHNRSNNSNSNHNSGNYRRNQKGSGLQQQRSLDESIVAPTKTQPQDDIPLLELDTGGHTSLVARQRGSNSAMTSPVPGSTTRTRHRSATGVTDENKFGSRRRDLMGYESDTGTTGTSGGHGVQRSNSAAGSTNYVVSSSWLNQQQRRLQKTRNLLTEKESRLIEELKGFHSQLRRARGGTRSATNTPPVTLLDNAMPGGMRDRRSHSPASVGGGFNAEKQIVPGYGFETQRHVTESYRLQDSGETTAYRKVSADLGFPTTGKRSTLTRGGSFSHGHRDHSFADWNGAPTKSNSGYLDPRSGNFVSTASQFILGEGQRSRNVSGSYEDSAHLARELPNSYGIDSTDTKLAELERSLQLASARISQSSNLHHTNDNFQRLAPLGSQSNGFMGTTNGPQGFLYSNTNSFPIQQHQQISDSLVLNSQADIPQRNISQPVSSSPQTAPRISGYHQLLTQPPSQSISMVPTPQVFNLRSQTPQTDRGVTGINQGHAAQPPRPQSAGYGSAPARHPNSLALNPRESPRLARVGHSTGNYVNGLPDSPTSMGPSSHLLRSPISPTTAEVTDPSHQPNNVPLNVQPYPSLVGGNKTGPPHQTNSRHPQLSSRSGLPSSSSSDQHPPPPPVVNRSGSSSVTDYPDRAEDSGMVFDNLTTPQFVRDTCQLWYRPSISRDQAILLLKDKPAGTFIVRDSHSFPNSFGLALKVSQLPDGVKTKSEDFEDNTSFSGNLESELVRHFLIELTNKGVRIRGCSTEPYFGSLSGLIYQHTLTPLALPCRLLLPPPGTSQLADPGSKPTGAEASRQSETSRIENIRQQGTTCKVFYLGSKDIESLTGHAAIARAIDFLLSNTVSVKQTEVTFKASIDGIMLTDNWRKLFFRRHYPLTVVSFCSMDSKSRSWESPETRARGLTQSRLFGFIARKSVITENTCHIFSECEIGQPAIAVVDFVARYLLNQQPS